MSPARVRHLLPLLFVLALVASATRAVSSDGKEKPRMVWNKDPHGFDLEVRGASHVPNGDFARGAPGRLPEGWQAVSARPELLPEFETVIRNGEPCLRVAGNGRRDCVGYVHTAARAPLGETYLFRVVFEFSENLDPHRNLLFQCFGPSGNDGILHYRRLGDRRAEGRARLHFPGGGEGEADVRVLFRLSADAEAWIEQVSLTPTDPVPPRLVRVACTQGAPSLERCRASLEVAGRAGVDLVLMPEAMRGDTTPQFHETVDGESARLMSEMARRYNMYVAGGILCIDGEIRYNRCLLFDRSGDLVGCYDKIHPYSPEINLDGIAPGEAAPVFDLDFGRVGVIICYDSWFTDVTELLALKGAEIILFPNAGYYRSLMPARAADNCVRFVTSTWNNQYGVWDTVGRDVLAPEADPTHKPVSGPPTFQDVEEKDVEGGMRLLLTTLDFNASPSPAHNGGTMYSAPGGRRSRRDQTFFLEREIANERRRWWME